MPFYGEEKTYLNEDIGVNELRVYRWLWLEHELIDVNRWPGYNEFGIITIDGIPFLHNSDTNFTFCNETPYNNDFKKRFDIFRNLRYLEDDTEDDDFNEFMASEKGMKFKKIEDNACNLYNKKRREIIKEHENLCNLYYNEFFKIEFPKYDFISINSKSGENTFSYDSRLMYFSWNYINSESGYKECKECKECKEYILVRYYDRNQYENNTYLCDEKYKIIQKVFNNEYLAEDNGNRTSLILQLHKRIHSLRKYKIDIKICYLP